MKNWFGIEGHPTDSYIHWTTNDKDRLVEAAKYRAAYIAIVGAGLEKELDILTEGAYESGKTDEYESTCEDL